MVGPKPKPKNTEPAAETQTVELLGPLTHAGRKYTAGDKIAVTPQQAQLLLKRKLIAENANVNS